MNSFVARSFVPPLIAVLSATIVAAQASAAWPDLDEATDSLTKAQFQLPSEAANLWESDDGLSQP